MKSFKQRRILSLLFCLTICAVSAQAQYDHYGRWENGVSEPWFMESESYSKEDAATARARWAAIEADIKGGTGGEWSGDYFLGGSTHGSYLRWSQQSGFVLLHVDKCAAHVMDFSYGKVAVTDRFITLLPERMPKKSSSHGDSHKMSTRYLRVIWRSAHYLVDETEVASFGDYVAGLGRYNEGLGTLFFEELDFFRKLNDGDEGSVDELPRVPQGYEGFLKRAVDARITGVGSGTAKPDADNPWWDELIIPVTISAGRAQGVKPQMRLRIMGLERDEMVEIRSVGQRSSKGVVIRSIRKRPCVKFSETDDCGEVDYDTLRIGLEVTTNPVK